MAKKVKKMFGGGMGAPIDGKFKTNPTAKGMFSNAANVMRAAIANKVNPPGSTGMGAAPAGRPGFGGALAAALSRGKIGFPKGAAGAPIKMGGMGMKKGGSVSSASKRADGCATKGKTKGKMV